MKRSFRAYVTLILTRCEAQQIPFDWIGAGGYGPCKDSFTTALLRYRNILGGKEQGLEDTEVADGPTNR